MARILLAVVLLLADVKYGSSTVKIPYAGLYSYISSSSSGVFERNRRLTNTKKITEVDLSSKSLNTTRHTKSVKSNDDFPCNKDGCDFTRNVLHLARDYASQEKSEKITNQRNRGSENVVKEAVVEENNERPFRLPRIDPIQVS